MTTHEIRQKYLDFFKSKGHVIVPSASLIPENDPTTLFTGSGMQPMVPYLLGEPHPEGTRIADSQKCFRTQDIEEVGDNRHTTFFEMLGNWSLGDYFKKEQIGWIFEFLTRAVGLDPHRLYVTCFRGNDTIGIPKDTESATLWQNVFKNAGIEAQIADFPERDGMQNGRIFYYDERKNWWSRSGAPDAMPEGEPGGPDSEMFWDFGEPLQLHEQSPFAAYPCHPNCDCGRFLEIGNSVFMEYIKTKEGFEPLPHKNVDFGGGLERIAAAAQDNPDIFMIEVFAPMRMVLEDLTKMPYGNDKEKTKGFRVILDHLRAAVFLIADGALPSNKDQGYFVRRLIRRAVRFGRVAGVEKNLCSKVGEAAIATYKEVYPILQTKKNLILEELTKEEEKFRKTLEAGLKVFERATAGKERGGIISGVQAFDLYQSYGFPLEVTEELARERGLTVDRAHFEKELLHHQALSRAGGEQKFKGGLADHSEMSVQYHTATHLLHATLRKVLGSHVAQKGSNITPERLRFDFSHPAKLTEEEKKQIEDMINEVVQRDLPVSFTIMSTDEAKKAGALGFFEDKYAQIGDKVKVYSIGEEAHGFYSREICGGPHVERSGALGRFKIIKEEAVSAGIRRIKAILE